MEYQKIINLLDNTNWFEVSDDACGTYKANSQIKFKTMMLETFVTTVMIIRL